MAERAETHKLLTVGEYLKLEEAATVKPEYVAGTIHAMVGMTKRHNRIALNIATRLLGARGGLCRVYAGDVFASLLDHGPESYLDRTPLA